MKANYAFRLAGLAVFLLASISPSRAANVLAQANSWPPPERIPYYDDDADAPYLVADRNRTVHAFNPQEIDGTPVILYSQWTLDYGWTTAVDILLLPITRHTDLGVFLDRAGMMHLVFLGLTDEGLSIHYSRALAMQAASARAWSPPAPVSEDASSPPSVALTGDDEGNLFVLYGGGRDGYGLYAINSPDAGNTWSQPTTVFLTYSDTLWPWAIHMDLDDQGRLHVVWSVMQEGGLGAAVWYARLEPDHLRWSTPVVLAERDEGDYAAEAASIIARQGELFVVYTDSFPPTRWFRRSTDGGETWTDPVRPFDHIGGYGDAVLLMDSSDTLHMILGNRLQYEDPPPHGMWHSVWQGDRWSPLKAIVSGPLSSVPGAEFAPTCPQAVVSQGNALLATWRTDRFAGRNGIWYSCAILDVPQLPVVALPTPTPTATATPLVPTPTLSPEATPAHQSDDSAMVPVTSSPAGALISGVVPAVLLLSAVIAVRRLRRNDHG